MRLLEPAAGQGAFILPLIPKLVRQCIKHHISPDALRPIVRAFEIDPILAASLRRKCAAALHASGLREFIATRVARSWIKNRDFLETEFKTTFSHIVGNPPYIRWDAVPIHLREAYKQRFTSFRRRADLYVAFIEKSLSILEPNGQLGFLCPGTWTRNVYGESVREALTSRGHLKTIFDFSDIDSFETPADAYPHFFVFQNGRAGATHIATMKRNGNTTQAAASTTRHFAPSASPLILNPGDDVAATVRKARQKFPTLEEAGCSVRVGSATGSKATFLIRSDRDAVEKTRILAFVNARSIENGMVRWSGTNIVNVFDRKGKPVKLSKYPRLRRYLYRNKHALAARAKAKDSKIWWRSIDALHPDWYGSRKLLVVDISAVPVIGLDNKGFCAGGGVYQIKSKHWPLRDLLVFLSAGVVGLFVGGVTFGSTKGFHRFQKKKLATIPIPRWQQLDKNWRVHFKAARRAGDLERILAMVAELYECRPSTLKKYVARDWNTFLSREKRSGRQ